MRLHPRHILCSTDLSDTSYPAIVYGIALAREFEARLTICHVVDLPSPSMYGEAYIEPKEYLDRSETYARKRIDEIMEGQNVRWGTTITVGNPADEIAKIAREEHIDVALAATRGHSGLKRVLIGSVTERLIHILPCPLLVVRRGQEPIGLPLDGEFRFQRILVGCDFSPDSVLANRHALSLAQEFQAELHLVHVIEPPTYLDLMKTGEALEMTLRDDIRQMLMDNLDNLIPEDARLWCTSEIALLEGRPENELIRYGEEHDVDLIVMGVRGRGLIGSLFVGSTTDRIVRRASCPVLAVCSKE
jgi:nucleotide-binding universal stress UspA family protein